MNTKAKKTDAEKNELSQQEMLEAAKTLEEFADFFRVAVHKMRTLKVENITTSNWVSSGERSFELLGRVKNSVSAAIGLIVLAEEAKQQVADVVAAQRKAESALTTTTEEAQNLADPTRIEADKAHRKRRH